MSRNNFLRLLFFAVLLLGLLAALSSIADLDRDGWPESLVTEGLLMPPFPLSVAGLAVLLFLVPAPNLPSPKNLPTGFTPPPIFNYSAG